MTVRRWKTFSAAALCAALSACSTAPEAPETLPQEPAAPVHAVEGVEIETEAAQESAGEQKSSGPAARPGAKAFTARGLRMTPVKFSMLPATKDADWETMLSAFRASCAAGTALRSGWSTVCAKAQTASAGGARAFFARNFTVWKASAAGKKSSDTGLMTGYYEPLLRGSLVRGGPYQTPVHAVPDDLVTLDPCLLGNCRGAEKKGKISGRRVVAYDDRAGILAREDLPARVLAWVDDPVEAFFLQVQGSGRIVLAQGGTLRVGYADHNGRPYRSVGQWLLSHTDIPRSQMSMQTIRAWAGNHPSRTPEMLASNPRYVFFRELPPAPGDGPPGAQGAPLTPKASVAADRRHWPLGVPVVVSARQQSPALAFARPAVVQDTGSAIRGPLRFDFYWGTGEEAGQAAGRQKSSVRAWALLPAGVPPARAFRLP